MERVAPSDGGRALSAALDQLDRFSWLVATSANGVRAIVERLDGRALPESLQVAAVGPATAAEFAASGIAVDLVPDRATAADLAAAFPPASGFPRADGTGGTGSGGAERPSVLAPLAELASDDLVSGLSSAGYRVERVVAYRMADTVDDPTSADAAACAAADLVAGAEAVVFTAPSIVERFRARFATALDGLAVDGPAVVCIGPKTGRRARDLGYESVVVAEPHTDSGIVAALIDRLGR